VAVNDHGGESEDCEYRGVEHHICCGLFCVKYAFVFLKRRCLVIVVVRLKVSGTGGKS